MAKKIPRKHFQKQEPKKIIYIAGLILALSLLILFGCTEMSSSEKGLCYSLSTKSYANVPPCETEDSCFAKVNEMFKTKLSYTQESKLYELKNHVARSWLFYNKANTKIKNIGKLCQGTNYSTLPGELNEAQKYIEQSFLELDTAMKNSFEFVGAEEKYLTEQEIDSIKEEKIYDSLVELRQIITELNTGATNSDSYVSYYLNKAESFSNSNITKGLPPLIEKQPIITATYDYVQGNVLTKLGVTKEYWFPALNSAFEHGLSYLESNIYSNQGIMALKKFPVAEFTKLYSDLGGNNTSALKRFADLVNRTSSSLEITQKSTELLWKENETTLKSCENTLNENERYVEFNELYSSLIGTTAVAKNEIKNQLETKMNEIIALREKKSKGNLVLGEELFELKTISSKLKEINLMLNVEKENYTIKLFGACDNLAKTANSETDITNEALSKLIYQIKYDASKTLSSKGKEKLMYCSQLQKETTMFNNAKNDYLKFQAEQKDSAKECFSYLKTVFNSIELNELKYQLDELSKTEVTKENLLDFVNACENIKRQVDYIASEEEYVIICEKEINLAEENLEKLKQITKYLKNTKYNQLTDNYSIKMNDYKSYFSVNGTKLKAKLDLLLPVQKPLSEKIRNLNIEIKKTIKESITEYAQNNLNIIYLNDFVAESGAKYNSNIRIIVPNPFETINEELTFSIKINPTKITQNNACVENIIQDKNEIKIVLSCLPAGGVSIEATEEGVLESKEEEEIIYASNKESLIKRTITLLNLGSIQKAIIHTTTPNNTTKYVVLNNGKEITPYLTTNTLSFALENLSPKEETSVFFYVNGLINTKTTIENTKNTIETNELNYTVIAQNTLAKKLTANIILDIPINSNVEEINIIKNDTEIISKKAQGNTLLISDQLFDEKQISTYKIQLIVNNLFDYYLEELAKQREELILLGETLEAEKIQKILSNGNKNNLKMLQTTFENTLTLLKKLNVEQEKQFAKDSLKQKVFDKIEELRTQIEELNNFGLEKEAKEIEDLIQSILALDLNQETNIIKAFDTLSKKSFSFNNTLKENVTTLSKKVEELTKNNPFEQLLTLKEKFLEEQLNFEQIFPFNPIEGKKYFIDLLETYDQIISLKDSYDLNLAKTIKETQKETNLLKEENLQLILDLENFFTTSNDLIKNKIIPPITQSRLAKLKLDILDINSTNTPIEETKQKLIKINEELSNAVNYLKREAIISFNKGIDLSLSNDTLTKAKKYIDQNDYSTALFLLSNATTQEKTPFNINYLLFVPILLIIISAFALKRSFGKKEKTKEENKKIILEEWEE